MNYPTFVETRLRAGEQLPSPVGWEQRIYQAQPGPFSFGKKTLNLSEELFVEEIDLSEGSIRVDGVIAEDRLQIGIFESGNYRLLGSGGSLHTSTLSYGGSLWDAIAAAPSRGVTFNAGAGLTQKIISEDSGKILISAMTDMDDFSSLVLPLNDSIRKLSKMINQALSLAQSGSVEQSGQINFCWFEEALIESACEIVDELTEKKSGQIIKKKNTYLIAHKIEDMLWEEPGKLGVDLDLEYLVNYLDCSRRQIQLALHEHFGTGFVALKRLVRLHQLNEKLGSSSSEKKIADLATEHNFDHLGRFSGYYREMFGATPQEARRKLRSESPRDKTKINSPV